LIGSSDANSLILSLIVKRLLRSTGHHKHRQFLTGIISYSDIQLFTTVLDAVRSVTGRASESRAIAGRTARCRCILQRYHAVSLPQHGFLVCISDHSNAEITHSTLIFSAVTQNHVDSRKSRTITDTTKITVKPR